MRYTNCGLINPVGYRLTLVALCCSLFSALTAAQPSDSELAARQQLEEVSNAISTIEQWLQQTRRQRSSEEAALAELDQQLTGIQTGIEENQARQLELQADIRRLDGEIEPLLAESEAQRAELASALEASYLAGSDSQLKLLLNQQDPAIAQRMLVYFEAFNQERLQQINRWLVTIGTLRQAQSEIANASQQLDVTTAELQEQGNSLIARQSERQALIGRLNSEMAARGTELTQLQEDRDGLQALIEEINRVIIDIPEIEDLTPFSEAKGRMPWPVAGSLLARFGQPYSNGQLRRQGIIIAADTGSAVRAIHPGRVVFSDWLRGSGNLLVVDHGNSYISLYAHNQQLIKHSGDWVNRGEPLALSGSDGGSGEPGIYFEIRRNSDTLNPVEWLEQQN
ncbi:MAG: peptidoglycan DD-metalloendopeptidase family protein [Pseudohongiella sp.]|nr:peptidoglycan DD-metalloendopeptidase family protein [Pseudohongiella sp.]MDO9520478.1 peptidoglycan DD-metalloendopeptidase family protein [Pseudohongiella sp.]MDP2126514.1 peptidoglycan DD-metalloendopeptidase family protein [Pseudohongiella sp.]